MAKNKKTMTITITAPVNVMKKALGTNALFRVKAEKNKKLYSRKRKHKKGDE